MLGIGQLLIIAFIVFVIFGAGKLPAVMGELGRGIKSFKDNLDGNSTKGSSEVKNKIKKNPKNRGRSKKE